MTDNRRQTDRQHWQTFESVVCGLWSVVSLCACGGTVDVASAPTPRIAVLSAFPAELAAVLEHASIDDAVQIDDHVFREGKLGGVSVVIGMTGIGLLNATNTTRAMLDRFKVDGVVFSGVAGSTLRIGDVSIPVAWSLEDGTTYTAYQPWLDLAETITAPGAVSLENCTVVPASGQSVCLAYAPAIAVGGVGQSSDPFGKVPVRCQPQGNDVFGCDVTSEGSASVSEADSGPHETVAAAAAEAPIVEDMETAAVAREVTARGLPFIGFRSVSDGPGDPLGLPGFPAQFFAYYRLSAHNAAAAAAAFLERLAHASATRIPSSAADTMPPA